MKILSIILAVLILGLSIRPCSDSISCVLKQENHQKTHTHCSKHTAETTDETGHNHESENHDCTPFCSCACCGINILAQHNLVSIIIKIDYNEPPIIYFNFQYAFEYFPSIFQPPQLS